MKRLKFKGWVLPSLYAFLFIGAFLVTVGVSNLFMEKDKKDTPKDNINYVTETVVDEEQPVVKQETKILKPFNSDKVSVSKYYYDYKGTEDNQENSLTYHDNTYMQNSGIDYKSDEVFDVISVLDGTVTDVKKDDLLGKSGTNTLDKEEGNHLHFEMYINGQIVNPLDYVDKEINTNQTMSTEENNNNQSQTED